MRIEPYLQFNGNCAQAFEYYRQHLRGEELCLMPYRGSPAADQVGADWQDKIMHGSVTLGPTMLMGADGGCPDEGGDANTIDSQQGMRGSAVCLTVDEPGEAERVFGALAQGGKVQMPLQETFWARKFGMLQDQFGVAWMINCLKPA